MRLTKPNTVRLVPPLFARKVRVVTRSAGRRRRNMAGNSNVHEPVMTGGSAKSRHSAGGI